MIIRKELRTGARFKVGAVHPMMRIWLSLGTPTPRATEALEGEEYEIVRDRVKLGDIYGRYMEVRQINGTKTGSADYEYVRSQGLLTQKAPLVLEHAEDDFSLNTDEEFVLVQKSDPSFVLVSIRSRGWADAHPKDITVGELVFSPQAGRRHRLKNKAVLMGYLNSLSGASNLDWNFFNPPNPQDPEGCRQRFHLHGLYNQPEWASNAQGLRHLSSGDLLELRKYSASTRKTSPVALPFDCGAYLRRHVHTMNLTRFYGEAVSRVIAGLIEAGTLDSFTHLLDVHPVTLPNPRHEAVSNEKDIAVDLAFKRLGLKKKDIPHANQHGMAAVAFSSLAEANAFGAVYSNPEKMVTVLAMADIRAHPGIDFAALQAQVYTQPANPKAPVPASPSSASPALVTPPVSSAPSVTAAVEESAPVSAGIEPPAKTATRAHPLSGKDDATSTGASDNKVSTADCVALLDRDPTLSTQGWTGSWKRLSKKKAEDGIERVFSRAAGPDTVFARVMEKAGALWLDRTGEDVLAVSGPAPAPATPSRFRP
jgi:hypothetical protein